MRTRKGKRCCRESPRGAESGGLAEGLLSPVPRGGLTAPLPPADSSWPNLPEERSAEGMPSVDGARTRISGKISAHRYRRNEKAGLQRAAPSPVPRNPCTLPPSSERKKNSVGSGQRVLSALPQIPFLIRDGEIRSRANKSGTKTQPLTLRTVNEGPGVVFVTAQEQTRCLRKLLPSQGEVLMACKLKSERPCS